MDTKWRFIVENKISSHKKAETLQQAKDVDEHKKLRTASVAEE